MSDEFFNGFLLGMAIIFALFFITGVI